MLSKKLISLDRTTQKPALLFLLCWLMVLVLYAPTWRNGFYMDFIASIENMDRLSFFEYINQADVAVTASFYQVTQSMIYFLLKLFGVHPLPWFLLFTAMFAFTGVVIFQFFKKLFSVSGWQVQPLLPLFGVLFILFAPISAEVVVWKACLQYHPATIIIFVILIWTLKFIETKDKRYIFYILILYGISTMMLEIFYLTPAFVFAISLSLLMAKRISSQQFKSVILKIFVPILVIWCIYLLIYFFTFNKWVAHYNMSITNSFAPINLLGKLYKILLHVLCFEYLLPFNQRRTVLEFVSQAGFVVPFTLLLVALLIWGFIKYHRLSPRLRMIILLFLSGILSCLIVIPLPFNDTNLVYNDRYYYLPGIFLFMMLACILMPSGSPYKWQKLIIPTAYLAFSVLVTSSFVLKFRNASKMVRALTHNYKFQDADTVVLLNLPNNFDGIFMIPAFETDHFNIHYAMHTGDSLQSKIYNVSSYNIKSPYDGAHVVVLDSMKFKVILNQGGSWWWFKAIGASDYENELFKVSFLEQNFSYLLELKTPLSANSKILFHANLEWKELDRSKIGEEQW